MFATAIYFHPSLIFAGKAGTYLEALNGHCFNGGP